MSSLIKNAHKSKLNQPLVSTTDNLKKETVLRKMKPSDLPRSYRLSIETLDILKEIQIRVGSAANKKISETKIISALILMSKNVSSERIIKALKQIL